MPMTSSTDWLPLYDGEFWNMRYYFTSTGSGAGTYNEQNNLSTTYHVEVQKASDYITGKIVHSGSLSITPTAATHKDSWSSTGQNRVLYLGGNTGSDVSSGGDLLSVNSYLYHALNNAAGGGQNDPGCGTFSGSIQEYKEWLEEIDQATFDLHTLNPTSYVSSLSPTSSYDTLVRHYPLGTDLNAIDRSTGAGLTVSSSHPNQAIKDFTDPFSSADNTYASASGFSTPSNSERGNYEPIEETYYVQGISLGGNNPRSQKIRLEDNSLIRPLSVTSTSERSSFDYAPIDSNRLGLFYSMADQINKDIFNHIGDVELDDYVGDPTHEFETSYTDLTTFSEQYWKKYSRQNDINAYIRIFSLFDFTLFNQIKQLIPARADVASGLLVEPTALERAKVKIYNQPEKSEPMYTASIHYMDIWENTNSVGSNLMTGSILPLSGTIDMPHKDLEISTVNIVSQSGYWQNEYTAYIPNSGSKDEDGNSKSSILVHDGNPFTGTVYKHISILFPYKENYPSATSLSLPLELTQSQHPLNYSPTGSIIMTQRTSLENEMIQINHYHSPNSKPGGKWENTNFRVVSESRGDYYSQSLEIAANRTEYINTQNQRFNGCQITAPGINVDSQIPALSFKPIIEVYETNANQLIYTQDAKVGNLDVR